MALHGENAALVTRDDGLPVCCNHSFIAFTFISTPSISPRTVSSRVFSHQPVKLSFSACCLVYLRKNTPCTRPYTSNSQINRDMLRKEFFSIRHWCTQVVCIRCPATTKTWEFFKNRVSIHNYTDTHDSDERSRIFRRTRFWTGWQPNIVVRWWRMSQLTLCS